jgi:hypothetical protein
MKSLLVKLIKAAVLDILKDELPKLLGKLEK